MSLKKGLLEIGYSVKKKGRPTRKTLFTPVRQCRKDVKHPRSRENLSEKHRNHFHHSYHDLKRVAVITSKTQIEDNEP